MQVLEKILQEIESAKKEPLFRLCDYTYRDRQNRIIARIEEIIRSHMEDEPVSNTYRLDDDKREFIDIQDERLWDILFEEACVEGEQADRIERRLREICISPMDDNGWIPVEEGYPKEKGWYQCTCDDRKVGGANLERSYACT